jgi:hypothetical protein
MSDAVYTLELLGVLLGVGLLARISHRQLGPVTTWRAAK